MPVSGIDFNTLNLYEPAAPPQKELGKDAFLQLLVAQLQHQDPLDPIKDQDFIGQLAQLTSLESTTNLNKTLETFVASQSAIQAVNFIGKDVKAIDEFGDMVEGRVIEITIVDGEPLLNVEGVPIRMQDLITVTESPASLLDDLLGGSGT